jgi:hypothetical protein
MSSILRIVMAASVANCRENAKDDGTSDIGHYKYCDGRGNKWTNLNNLYFAHRWFNHTILEVVANDTFREIKAHAEQKKEAIFNGKQSTNCRSRTTPRTIMNTEL